MQYVIIVHSHNTSLKYTRLPCAIKMSKLLSRQRHQGGGNAPRNDEDAHEQWHTETINWATEKYEK